MGTHTKPEPRTRKRFPLLILAVIVLGLAAAGISVWASPPAAPEPVPSPVAVVPDPVATPASTTVEEVPEQVVEIRSTTIVEGAVSVGEIAAPGLWMSQGGEGCRWSRDAGTSWSFDTGGMATEPITISLRLGTEFETVGCAPWTLVRAIER